MLDKRNNYEVDNISDNKNLNTYKEVLEKAREKINYEFRIEQIAEYLRENRNNKKIIVEMENIINEGRKVQSN